MVKGLIEEGLSAFNQGFDVFGVFVEGLEGGCCDIGRSIVDSIHYCDDGRFVARHGVVGVEGDDEEFVGVIVMEFFDDARDSGVAVAHGEFDGDAYRILDGFLEFLAAVDEGGTVVCPNSFISFAGFFGA